MKKLFAATCFAVASMAIVTLAQEKKAEGKKPTVARVVVPSEGVTAFTVTGRSTLFRLPISTISGGTISEPEMTGSVRHVRTEEIIEVGPGGDPLVGSLRKEFVFRGTGAGKVMIKFEKTLPTEPGPIIETYTVTIK